MNILDIPFLVEIFFGISLVVFCIAIYVILPAFIYNKKTVFRPKLINAMWNRFLSTPKAQRNIDPAEAKKKLKRIVVSK